MRVILGSLDLVPVTLTVDELAVILVESAERERFSLLQNEVEPRHIRDLITLGMVRGYMNRTSVRRDAIRTQHRDEYQRAYVLILDHVPRDVPLMEIRREA